MIRDGKERRFVQWLKNQPFWGLYSSALVLAVIVVTVFRTIDGFRIETIDAASTILSTTAQVSATLTGFLIVAMVFLIDRRRRVLGENWTLWDVLDIASLAIALFVLALAALGSTVDLVYVLSQPEVNGKVTRLVLESVVLLEIGTAATFAGLGFTYGYEFAVYRARRKSSIGKPLDKSGPTEESRENPSE